LQTAPSLLGRGLFLPLFWQSEKQKNHTKRKKTRQDLNSSPENPRIILWKCFERGTEPFALPLDNSLHNKTFPKLEIMVIIHQGGEWSS
jgi:hypothetical protein